MISKVQATKEKNKLYYIKIKEFCAENNTSNKVKIQSNEWERMLIKKETCI